jgi:hypothetical protein
VLGDRHRANRDRRVAEAPSARLAAKFTFIHSARDGDVREEEATMRRIAFVSSLFLLAACSSSSEAVQPTTDGALDAPADTTVALDAPDTAPIDSTSPDTASGDAGDAGGDADVGDGGDGAVVVDGANADAGCPSSWTITPVVDGTLAVPADGGGVLLHAQGVGTQNYQCKSTSADGGVSYAWTFVGPVADLNDCHGAKIGTHFASAAGPTAPEWQQLDGTAVIGSKLAAETPDGGAAAIPWLLLQATSTTGTGTLSKTKFVQRLNTTNGLAPTTGCDSTTVGATQNVSYTADYYFYGN